MCQTPLQRVGKGPVFSKFIRGGVDCMNNFVDPRFSSFWDETSYGWTQTIFLVWSSKRNLVQRPSIIFFIQSGMIQVRRPNKGHSLWEINRDCLPRSQFEKQTSLTFLWLKLKDWKRIVSKGNPWGNRSKVEPSGYVIFFWGTYKMGQA